MRSNYDIVMSHRQESTSSFHCLKRVDKKFHRAPKALVGFLSTSLSSHTIWPGNFYEPFGGTVL